MYRNHLWSPWQCDPEFVGLNLIANTQGSMVDTWRMFHLWEIAKSIRHMHGSVAEMGVFRGGSLYMLSRVLRKETRIEGYDTFTGMPDNKHESDSHKAGDFKTTSLEDVQRFIGKDYGNVKLIPGFFPDSVVNKFKRSYSLVHIDCDIYKSVMDCCEFFYPNMCDGGVMVFDDYGFDSCKGAKLAVDEFFADKNDRPIYLSSGQAIVFRKKKGRLWL